jgi:hypothetical protein
LNCGRSENENPSLRQNGTSIAFIYFVMSSFLEFEVENISGKFQKKGVHGMLASRYLLTKYGLTTMVPLALTVVFVMFTAMPAMGQTEGIIRNGTSQLFVPPILLLICMGAQILIAAGLGIYFLRRFFHRSPGHLPHSEQGRQAGQTGVYNPAGWAEDYPACSLE